MSATKDLLDKIIGKLNATVKTEAQTLTEAQKAQARANIGAIVPQKGVDYWTDADQEQIVQAVITALGTPVFGRPDEDNNIILTGDLPDGTHNFYYMLKNGSLAAIGSLDVGAANYTNQIPISTDEAGNVYNGKGYKENTRVSGGNDVEYAGITVTGYIPVKEGDTIYLKNLTMPQTDSTDYTCRVTMFNAKTSGGGTNGNLQRSTTAANWVWDESGNASQFSIPLGWFGQSTPNRTAFIRIHAAYIGPDSIVTVNEPIE